MTMKNAVCLLSFALLALIPASQAWASGAPPVNRACMTEPAGWYGDAPENIRKRFELYRSMGVDTLRIEIEWRSIEPEEGRWNSSFMDNYLELVKEYGFKVKFIDGALMGPPGWFLDKHPDAQITDQNGKHSRNTMSFWYPELCQVVEEKTRYVLGALRRHGMLDSLDSIIPALGPAGEPIYPVPWTLGPDFGPQTFWCYDENAQKSFREAMRSKYGPVERANSVWKTRFASWDDVRVLKPGSQPGAYWNDVLTWYRDSKRNFIDWHIDMLRKYVPKTTNIVLYIPGTAYGDKDWAEAVKTGAGNDLIKMMGDSFFMIDTAVRKGCWLQYTGVDNDAEVERLRRYMDGKGYTDLVMWGENAGDYGCAKDPLHLADVIIKNRLCGLDYTHAHFAFEKDRVTPNEIFPKLKEAYVRIRERHP